tara:strand:+ start:4891 stop:6414 length:1524 start_codon:yes stop_codon:yes gene_type:complete
MAINPGGSLNSVPAPQRQALASNYLDFTASGTNWSQQYLPDLMEKEAEVFGPRTISGFLSKIGAEEAMTSDQVIWSEQGRLHLSYKAEIKSSTTIQIQSDIDGNNEDTTNGISGSGASIPLHGIRVNDTIIVATSAGVCKAMVTAFDGSDLDLLTVAPYDAANMSGTAGSSTAALGATVLVYGSEYGKGSQYFTNAAAPASTDSRGANEPDFKTFTNKPIIMKDYYEVSGSDTSRIGWVEITGEEGQSGYLWYLKAESDTRARFNDYLEMSMLEAELNAAASTLDGNSLISGSNSGANQVGTEGLFAAIESRGNITTGVTGVNAATDLAEFDAILAEFDKQGAIEENMLFVNRATSLAFDDMLASMNSYGAGGTSYGVFENDEDMALNLGFSGFRRGSYDFYKSDFRYLNDKATRGGINDAAGANAIRGVIIPAGTSTVYDQQLGKNLKRPFLHVRYRASQTDDRRMKTWTTGSVGASTSALDAMQIHFLSERCLITQGANNFMLMK